MSAARPLAAGAALTALALILQACAEGGDTLESGEDEIGTYAVDPATGETRATVETREGTATMRSGRTVPVDLPPGFLLYPGATVLENTRVGRGEGRGALIVFRSEASPERIADYYRAQATQAGVTIEVELATEDSAMVAGRAPGGTTLSLNAAREGATTTAELMIGRGLN